MNREIMKRIWPGLLIIALFASAFYYPLPYYVSKPGEAVELAPIIQVKDKHPEEGTFMLTTVRMGGANFFNYSLAKWDSYMDLIPKDVLLAHYKSEEHYSQRQLQVMKSSQESAILVAYKLAGKPIQVQNDGIIVTQTVEGLPAEQYLQIGDLIHSVDEQRMETSEELIGYITSKNKGDTVKIAFLRNDNEQIAGITLDFLPQSEEEKAENQPPRVGIGIATMTKRSLANIDPPIEIKTDRIGGPSAGLMFTLEIYNQLTELDITKGYRIAGTGTIGIDGNVGRIGGIHQKIVAADKAKVDFFFAPNEGGAAKSNYQIALAAAQDIKTEMKVIPVDNVQDALDYLASIPAKNQH